VSEKTLIGQKWGSERSDAGSTAFEKSIAGIGPTVHERRIDDSVGSGENLNKGSGMVEGTAEFRAKLVGNGR